MTHPALGRTNVAGAYEKLHFKPEAMACEECSAQSAQRVLPAFVLPGHRSLRPPGRCADPACRRAAAPYVHGWPHVIFLVFCVTYVVISVHGMFAVGNLVLDGSSQCMVDNVLMYVYDQVIYVHGMFATRNMVLNVYVKCVYGQFVVTCGVIYVQGMFQDGNHFVDGMFTDAFSDGYVAPSRTD
jgi:hypothetical protein